LAQSLFVFSRRKYGIHVAVSASIFRTLIVNATGVLVKPVKGGYFPRAFGYLVQQLSILIVLVNMVSAVLFPGPEKTVVVQKGKIVRNVHIGIVLFLKDQICGVFGGIHKNQIYCVLVAVGELYAQQIIVLCPK